MAVDADGYLSVYDIADIKKANMLSNKRRVKYTDGREIKLDGYAGLSGRIKIEGVRLVWKNDVIFGTKEGQRQPFNEQDKSLLFLLRNQGTVEEPVYDGRRC